MELILFLFGVAVFFGVMAAMLYHAHLEEMREYGVTDEVREASRYAEPDETEEDEEC